MENFIFCAVSAATEKKKANQLTEFKFTINYQSGKQKVTEETFSQTYKKRKARNMEMCTKTCSPKWNRNAISTSLVEHYL